MEKLELVCIGHISLVNLRSKDCTFCKLDEENYNCPNYLSVKAAIEKYRPGQPSQANFSIGIC